MGGLHENQGIIYPQAKILTSYRPQKTNKLYLFKIQYCRSTGQVILFQKGAKEKEGRKTGFKQTPNLVKKIPLDLKPTMILLGSILYLLEPLKKLPHHDS